MKRLFRNQRGVADIGIWISLTLVLGMTFMLIVSLGAFIVIFDARSDTQRVADYITLRYRDEGCITQETKNTVYEIMNQLKMEPSRLYIDGEDTTPLDYGTSKVLNVTYNFPFMLFPGVSLNKDIPIPLPVSSQYSPQLGGPRASCVAM
ncbi:hypothetical protein D3C78_18260 [compost metagenome]